MEQQQQQQEQEQQQAQQQQQKVEERKKIREEKARLARLAVIQVTLLSMETSGTVCTGMKLNCARQSNEVTKCKVTVWATASAD